MKITVLSVGKKPRGAEAELIDEYIKRIQKPWNITWKYLPHQQGDKESAKKAESTSLLEAISDNEMVILLDERGTPVDNEALATMLNPEKVVSGVVIIIGGAYGVDERVHARANEIVAISSLILPHKLVRVLLAEQLYRTQAILQGHPYHHE